MADSIVNLKVNDDSFNAKIKEAARSFADFGKRVASTGVEAMGDFAKGAKTAKAAFEGFNAALKANALVLVASLAMQTASAIGEMIGNWITGADDAADAQANLNAQLEETQRLVDNINNEGDFNARLAKAAGASTSEVLKIKADAAQQAMNTAMATLFDPNIKVGTEEYDKAKKIFEAAEKKYQKALQDIKVDETAREHRTGEYAPHKTGGSGRPKLSPTQQASADIQKAEKAYADTMTNAQQKLLEQMINGDKYDKDILQGQQKLADAYLKAYNMTGDEKYLSKFRETAEHVVTMQAVVDAATAAHKEEEKAAKELAASQKKLSDAQKEAATAQAGNDLKGFYAANKKVTAAGGTATAAVDFTGTTGNIDAFIQNLKDKISQSEVGTDLYNNLTAQLADASMLSNMIQLAAKNGVDMSQFDPKTLWTKIFGENPGDYIDDAKWEEIRLKLEEIIGKPITIDVNTGALTVANKAAKDSQKEFQAAASAIQQAGSAMQSIEDPSAKVMGIVAQAIGSIALGFAQASAQEGKGGIWYWIAATAAGLATMESTISAIHSATGYAQGGIVKAAGGTVVPGNNYSGDMVPAMLNSGELVLNRAQQGNLASQLEGGGMQNLQLSATIRGEDIKLVLNNNSRRTGHGEYVTTNFR